MKPSTYFEKNGEIYGISEKHDFGKWSGYVVKFNDFEIAEKWLHTEEGDFRERELVSKTVAEQRGYGMPERYYNET